MLNDGTGFKKVYIATGFTDICREIDGFARIIRLQFHLNPYDKLHYSCFVTDVLTSSLNRSVRHLQKKKQDIFLKRIQMKLFLY